MTEQKREIILSSLRRLTEDIVNPKTKAHSKSTKPRGLKTRRLDTRPLKISDLIKSGKILGLEFSSDFLKLSNDYFNIVMEKKLTPTEQAVYLKLYREALRWRLNCCQIKIKDIEKSCNISRYPVILAINSLISKGLLKILRSNIQRIPPIYEVIFSHPTFFRGLKTRRLDTRPLEELEVLNLDLYLSKTRRLDTRPLEDNNLSQNELQQDFLKKTPPKDIYKDIYSLSYIIYNIYSNIGQTKISKSKLEKGERVLKDLLKEGYTMEEIKFSLEELKKIPDVKDIALLKHTISQSVAKLEKKKKEEGFRKIQQEKQKQEQSQQTAIELKNKAITKRIDSLPQEERQKLTQKARELTKDQQDLPFYETIVRTKEREIISQEMGKTTLLDEEITQKLGVSLVKIP